jgi:hypothetical protein
MFRKVVKLKKVLATAFGTVFLASGATFLALLRLPLPAKTKLTEAYPAVPGSSTCSDSTGLIW